tara:strand:- start:2158 stop:2883 length:726 start_codon:yes stop_codon:yes gene_type:complete
MSFVTAALIAGGATLASAYIGSRAAGKAADVQSAAARSAAELQKEQYEQTRQDLAPWRAAGEQALNKLIPMTDYTKFGAAQFQQDPGYAFRLSEGQKALDRSAAARGGLISGGALKAAQRYGQDMGSQEYMNAFNRYQTERAAQLQPLQSLAGVGQTTATQLGQAGQNYASNAGNLMTSGAAAQGAGYVGQANAITGGLGTYLNYSQGNALLNALRGGGGGGGNYATVSNPYFTPMGGGTP